MDMDTTCKDCGHGKNVHSAVPGTHGCRVAHCKCIFFDHGSPPPPVTPAGLRRSVLAALKERAAIGDTLATGAIKVIEHLEEQANRLAWDSCGKQGDV